MRTVIEAPTFQKHADAIWTAQDREAFIDFIAENVRPRGIKRS